MTRTPKKSNRARVGVLLIAVLVAASFAVGGPSPARAQGGGQIAHGQLVPEIPNNGIDRILDGRVLDIDQVGGAIVVGGDFTQVELSDGTVVNQPYLAAFSIQTGDLLAGFRPVLDKEVITIEAGDTFDTVFVGGKFNTVNGQNYKKLVKLSLVDGTIDPKFKANATSQVRELLLTEHGLFVGGDFLKIKGKVRERIALLAPKNGKVNEDFTIGVTGNRSQGTRSDGWVANYSGSYIRGFGITPDGNTLLVMHRGEFVGGLPRDAAAMIDVSDITNPSVLPWSTDLFPASDFVLISDGEMSPDGSYFVVTTGIGNFPPIHDTTIAFPVAGGPNTQPLWVTQNFDSTYGIAISDEAVYVGGHFCWTEGPLSVVSPLYVPGRSGNDLSCARGGAVEFEPEAVFRDQITALDPATGHALNWDPGSDAFNGVRSLEVTSRGLLLGHDGNFVGGVGTGRMAFFDLGGTLDVAPPTQTIEIPTKDQNYNNEPVVIEGVASDDTGIANVRVAIKDRATNLWLQNDGTFGGFGWLTLSYGSLGAPITSWSLNPALPDGSYRLQAKATDIASRKADTASVVNFTVTSIVDVAPPDTSILSHSDGETIAAGLVNISGNASDDTGIDRLILTVRNTVTGNYLQRDGTFGNWQNLEPVFNQGAISTGWAETVTLPTGIYTVKVRSFDLVGQRDPSAATITLTVE